MEEELFYKNYNIETLPGEIWRDCPLIKGRYLVSNLGRVKTIARKTKKGIIVGSIIKKQVPHNGYLMVGIIRNDNKKWTISVHRLVAMSHLDNPFNKKTVNHIKGNKKDNRSWMLEWATYKENIKHSKDTGLMRHAKGENQGQAKFTNSEVIAIFESKEPAISLAKKYNVHEETIRCIRRGETYSSVTGAVYNKVRMSDLIVKKIFLDTGKNDSELAIKYNTNPTTVAKIRKGKAFVKITSKIKVL